MKPQRINYENQVSDFRQNFMLDARIRDLMYKYENEDWIFYIEFTGTIQGSTDANVKAYTWDENTQTSHLKAVGKLSEGQLSIVA